MYKFKKYLQIVFIYIIRLVNTVFPKNAKLVVFFSLDGYMGNLKALYMFFERNLHEYKIIILLYDKKESIFLKRNRINAAFAWSLKGLWIFFKAKYIIATHLEFSRYKAFIGQKYINLWHGMPIKKISA